MKKKNQDTLTSEKDLEALLKDFENKLAEQWEVIREEFFYPPLPSPRLKPSLPTAGIMMETKKIECNPSFIQTLKEGGMDPSAAFHGVLSHEVDHFMFFPFDLPTSLVTIYECEKISQPKAKVLANLFSDVSINLHLILKKNNTTISQVYKALSAPKAAKKDDDPAMRLLCAYYQEVTGMDFGAKPIRDDEKQLKDKLDSMRTINFLDKNNYRINVRRFARIIHDLVKEDANPDDYDMTGENGFNSDKIDPKEIEKAMRKIAKEINDPKKFKDFIERHKLKKGDPADEKSDSNEKTAGLSPVNSVTIPDWYYYAKLAENYPVKLKKKPLEKDGSLYPYSYKKWEVSEPVENIDHWNSFGKILPGITQQRVMKDAITYKKEEAAPNLVLVIDSSGSMTNPATSTSYAVVGGISVANVYLDNGSKVAVDNFSTSDIVTEFTTVRREIYATIAAYQGGGTTINTKIIRELVERSEKPCDVVIISDTAIFNLGDLLEFLDKLPNKNRATIVHTIEENAEIKSLREKYAGTNTSVYSGLKEDLPKIVVGEANKSIK